MNRKIYWGVVFIVVIIVGTYSYLQEQNTLKPITKTTLALDTICTITVFDEKDQDAMNETLNNLQSYQRLLGRHNEGDTVYALNENLVIDYDSRIAEVIQYGEYLATITDGKFSIHAKTLIDLWGIGSDSFLRPSDRVIKDALSKINESSVTITENTIEVSDGIELGAIAKGYIGDLVKDDLESKGVKSAIINLGGNVVLVGSKPNGDPWNVGVQSPEETRGMELGSLRFTSGKAIISSGIYERYSKDSAGVYHHILDATSGYPSDNGLAQVTIVADKSIVGDGMSTAVFLMGLDEGLEFVEKTEGLEAIIVTIDKNIYITTGLKNNFTLTDKSYKQH